MKYTRWVRRVAGTMTYAVLTVVASVSCSLIGGGSRFEDLPDFCFDGITPAVEQAVGPLFAQSKVEEVSGEDSAISRPSHTTKSCARSFNDPIHRQDWKAGEPNFRRIFLEYDLYQGGFFSGGSDEAKRQYRPPLVEEKRLHTELELGDEAVGWWEYSQRQGATWQISLRIENMRVLVRVSGANYREDYSLERQFSPRLDYDSPHLQDDLRKESQLIARAIVKRLQQHS